MRLADAQTIIRQASGRTYTWLNRYGLSTIKESIRTIEDRMSATDVDREYAEDVNRVVWRGY